MQKNKFTTYLLYATGEIFLVVIGILIAVSINNWNQKVQNREKERSYLKDIKVELEDDIALMERVLAFDSAKQLAIKNILILFGSVKQETELLPLLPPHLNKVFEFEVLGQSRVAFDNMIAAESIDLITDNTLRKLISEYYSINYVSEERTKEMTRGLADIMVPYIVSSDMIKLIINVETDIRLKKNRTPLQENPEIVAGLVNVSKNLEYQIRYAQEQKEEAIELIRLINVQIDQ